MSNSHLIPKPSSESNVAVLTEALTPLLTVNGGRWTLAADGEAIEREFKFKTFAKTWPTTLGLHDSCLLQCKLKSHHPEWSNVFNTTFIRWTTHHPKGLSQLDVELAATCDQLAKDFGEVVPPVGEQKQQQLQPQEQKQPKQQPKQQQEQEQEQEQSTLMCSLVGRATGAAGDCCVPKNMKK